VEQGWNIHVDNVTKKEETLDQKKEGRKHYGEFHWEMKDVVATCH